MDVLYDDSQYDFIILLYKRHFKDFKADVRYDSIPSKDHDNSLWFITFETEREWEGY